MSIIISKRLYIDWDADNSFTNESAYLISASADMRYAAPYSSLVGGAGITSQMSLVLDNSTGRFSPLNTSGALYSFIGNGGMYMRPCYLEVSIDGSNYYTVFYGVLKLPGLQSPTWTDTSTVTLDVRSRDELLLNRRWSLPQSDFKDLVDYPRVESDIMMNWITDSENGFSMDDLDLDNGLFQIPFPWMDDESLLEEMWALAAACGGRFYADNTGTFRYENMAAWQVETRSKTSQQTYTPATWQRMEFRYDDSDLYNAITVEASTRAVGAVDVVWESESIVSVQPGKTEVITARFDAPAYSITQVEYAARDTSGNSLTSSISVVPTYKAQRAKLSVVNSATQTAYLTKLRILGKPVVGGPEHEATKTSSADGDNSTFFSGRIDRDRRIGGNPYIQSAPLAQTLAQRILDVSEYPRLTFLLSGADGNPDRRLGDRITINDTNTMSASMECYVVGLRWVLDKFGFVQDIEAVQAANVFKNDGDYFVIGTHALGSTRKVFY